MGTIDPRLLDLLVCPVTKTRLIYNKDTQELISTAVGLAYPIRNGIPIMLTDDARPLSADEADKKSASKKKPD